MSVKDVNTRMYLVSFGVYKRWNPEIACQSAKGARDLVDMFSGVTMRFIMVIMVLGIILGSTQAKSRKKLIKDEASLSSAILNKKLTGKSTKPSPPAILAIEIVDPNENKTNKNAKRTIDSALGYGYQNNNYQPPPRYEVYKYSQQDIPPYQGQSLNLLSKGIQSHNFDIQKSVSYNLSPPPQPDLSQYYQPGTTLFSTVNNQGQLGGLSSHIPQNGGGPSDPQVPVIILRVYPSQLNDPSAILHPNLPQSHPLASTINSLDIQSILTKYVQKVLVTENHQSQDQGGYGYEPPNYQQYQPQQHQEHHHQDSDLLTHENYPKDTHTRVVFRTDKNQAGVSAEGAMLPVAIPPIHGPPQSKPTFRIHVPDSYSSVEVQTPDMEYGYAMQDQNQASYYYNEAPQQHQSHQQPEQTYYYHQGQQDQDQNDQYHQYQEQEQVQPQQYVQVQSETYSGGNYQQQQQQTVYQPDNADPAPYNYHAHQKRAQRSKKNTYSRLIPEASTIKEIGRLKLIKA